jgi:hypothetical protein
VPEREVLAARPHDHIGRVDEVVPVVGVEREVDVVGYVPPAP